MIFALINVQKVYFPASRTFDLFFFNFISKGFVCDPEEPEPISTDPVDHVEHISDLLFYVFI